jgi:outer membrane protein TolC
VLANNQDLNIAVSNAEATQYFLLATEGIFDPVLGAFFERNHEEQPASSQLVGAVIGVNDNYNYGVEVTQLAPWGGSFSLGTNGGWFKTNSEFYDINPSYNAGMRVTFSQPLLRNFGFTPTKWQIYIAKNDRDASYQRFIRSIQTGVNSVEQAYWDLVYAYQNLEVAKETLRIAQDLNRITKIRIDVGSLAPIDITQTEVGIAEAEQQIITAEGQIGNFQDALKRLMSFDPAQYTIPIIATDSVRVEPATVRVEEGMRTALDRRPEIVAQAYAVDSGRVQYEYWSNQTLPGVNLFGSYGNNGLDGTFTNPNPPPAQITNGLGDAYGQVFDRSFKSWSIGLNVSYPILNRYAKGQRGAAKYLLESSRATLTTTQQNVIVEVRDAARAIDTAKRQIAATGKGRELAERNLDAEKKKFDNGMTTSFQVNQIQRDLSAARTRELQALVIYRKAVAAYHNAIADNLEWRGISVEGIPEATPPPMETQTVAAASAGR